MLVYLIFSVKVNNIFRIMNNDDEQEGYKWEAAYAEGYFYCLINIKRRGFLSLRIFFIWSYFFNLKFFEVLCISIKYKHVLITF